MDISIHLIYKFNSNKYKEYNGLLIEVQIRSRLQHLWATAVETAGCFTKQAIKSNQGDPNWSEFFRLVSSVFANIENTPTVPNTPSHEKELYDKIIKLESKLDVIERMTGWTASLNTMNKKFPRDIKFFLLQLDTSKHLLTIRGYRKDDEKKLQPIIQGWRK